MQIVTAFFLFTIVFIDGWKAVWWMDGWKPACVLYSIATCMFLSCPTEWFKTGKEWFLSRGKEWFLFREGLSEPAGSTQSCPETVPARNSCSCNRTRPNWTPSWLGLGYNQEPVKSDHEQGEVEKFFFEENFFKLTGALAHHVRLV